MRYGYRRNAPAGPPTWFVFLIGVAVVFGIYYAWNGIVQFLSGVPVLDPTTRAVLNVTATVQVATQQSENMPTRRPSATPLPECIPFIVSVENAFVREQPGIQFVALDQFSRDTEVCVLERAAADPTWYLIDRDTRTRRIEPAYMSEAVIRPMNPTPTPSPTPPPAPSVTASFIAVPGAPTITPLPSATQDQVNA